MVAAGVDASVVHPKLYEFYSHWYYTVIRGMVTAGNYRLEDAESIARELRPTISTRQAATALLLLLKLDFIRKNNDGIPHITEKNISTPAT